MSALPRSGGPDALFGRIAVVSGALCGWHLDAVTAALVGCGVTAIEPTVGPDGHVATHRPDARRAGARMRELGVTVCGAAATGAHPLGSPGLDAVLEAAAELRAPWVRVFAAPFRSDTPVDGQLDAAAAALATACEAADPAVAVLLEPADGTVAASPELARLVLERAGVRAAGVVFDPGSLVAEGHLQPALALGVLAGRIAHVHVKNRVLVRNDGRWRSEARSLEDGRVDWTETLQRLAAGGYAGWLSIDHLSGPAEVAVLRRDVAALRQLVAAATPLDARSSHADDL